MPATRRSPSLLPPRPAAPLIRPAALSRTAPYRPVLHRRRNVYIEVPELARMSDDEVAAYRAALDGVKVRGKDVPKPVKNWNQVGGVWCVVLSLLVVCGVVCVDWI